MRNNAHACGSECGLLSLRDHPADKKLHSKLWEQLSSFERIPRNQRFFLPMLLLFVEDIYEHNPACFIENR
jgi:hypothetical protein